MPSQTALPIVREEPSIERIGRDAQFEEALFLGLRIKEGLTMADLRREFGDALVRGIGEPLAEVGAAGLVETDGNRVRLTARGRMASNEVFSRLLVVPA
jgi:oxygen-independent coproporphyrinogen-3 oxidase